MSNLRRRRDRILRRDDAHKLLKDFYDDFTSAATHGLNQLASIPPAIRGPLKPRTLANVLNDHIVENAIRLFDSSPGWKINQDFDGTFFVFGERAALRFKKVEGAQSPSNVRTDRQVDIGYQMEVVGIQSATYINIGYEVNQTWTGLKSVSLSCFRGASLVWSIPISEQIEAFLFDHEGNATESPKPVVRAAGKEKKLNG
jgi:hypothetical protein